MRAAIDPVIHGRGCHPAAHERQSQRRLQTFVKHSTARTWLSSLLPSPRLARALGRGGIAFWSDHRHGMDAPKKEIGLLHAAMACRVQLNRHAVSPAHTPPTHCPADSTCEGVGPWRAPVLRKTRGEVIPRVGGQGGELRDRRLSVQGRQDHQAAGCGIQNPLQ